MSTPHSRIRTQLKQSLAQTHRLIAEVKNSAEELKELRKKLKADKYYNRL